MSAALSVVRPAAAALVLLAAVAVTGLALYTFWPAGVALGIGLGAAAVLAVGARMQVAQRLQPADADLASRLGIEPEPVVEVEVPIEDAAPSEAVAPAASALAPAVLQGIGTAPASARTTAPSTPESTVAAMPLPQLRPSGPSGVLYFTSDHDPDASEARVVVATDESDTTAPGIDADDTDALQADDDVRTDLEGLKDRLGDDYHDFARAARLVVSTQYASAARLQRDLELPYSRARRLLGDLEQQHFVGPATGSLPRQVLMPKERLPEVEALLADA